MAINSLNRSLYLDIKIRDSRICGAAYSGSSTGPDPFDPFDVRPSAGLLACGRFQAQGPGETDGLSILRAAF